MTKTKALKKFIKKFIGYDAIGNSVTTVLTDATENGEASGGGGYECKEELKTIVDDTIVLEEDPEREGFYGAELQDLSVTIKEMPNNIAVTFDGKAYQLPLVISTGAFWIYGEYTSGTEEEPPAPVFDNFPVFVQLALSENVISRCFISSNISGEHTIKIEISEESVTVTPCFKKAVAKATTENNRTYIIPETTGETKTRTDEIADVGKVTFYYLDVSVNADETFPLYFEVDGKLTTLNTMDELQNFVCTTPSAVIKTLKSSEYALGVSGEEAIVFFREPGTHTVSMYVDKQSGNSDKVVVTLNITYDYVGDGSFRRCPTRVNFSKDYNTISQAIENGNVVFNSTDTDEMGVVPFMYRLERNDDTVNIHVYRIYPLDAELAVEGFRLSSENVSSVSYVTVSYSSK